MPFFFIGKTAFPILTFRQFTSETLQIRFWIKVKKKKNYHLPMAPDSIVHHIEDTKSNSHHNNPIICNFQYDYI